jgi:hypothetical protein
MMNRKTIWLLLVLPVMGIWVTDGQDSTAAASRSQINRARLFSTLAIETAAYGSLCYYLGNVWYKGHDRVPFHFHNDNRAYLQMDKFGHVWGSYVESYIGYKMLRWSGVKKGSALWLGGTLGILLQAPIEIFDGIYDGWGFSWGDMAANIGGSALVIGQELLLGDEPLKYKWTYHQAPYYLSASGNHVENPFRRALFDYNGHTYWLSFPVKTILPVKRIPRWINLAAGYGADGMFGKFENLTGYDGMPVPQIERYRQFYLSLDVDWIRIPTQSAFLKALFNMLVFIKLPFPALEINTLGQVKGHWLYY